MNDFLIVGTGPSAFFLTKTLLDKNPTANIIVLEAGQKLINPNHLLSLRKSSSQEFKLDPTINIGYGGTSQLWHNVLAPLDSEDFHHKPWIHLSGWPIKKDSLDPHYKKVSSFFGFDFDIFDNPENFINYHDEINRIKFDESIFSHKVLMHPLNYLRTNKSFDELKKKYPSLNIIKGAIALRFEYKENINSLIFYNLNEKKFVRITSKNFVLSAGALNNPEILFNSKHICRNLPLLGKCLMDHPMGNFYQFKYSKPISARIYQSYKFKKGFAIKTALKLKKNIRERLEMANSVFYLQPSFSEGFNNETEILKLKLLTVREKIKNFKLPINEIAALTKNFNMAAQIVQYKTGLLSKHRITDCMFVTEQTPFEKSSVKITNKINRYGNKETEVDWRLSSEDFEEVAKAHDYINKYLMSLNNALPTYDPSNYFWKDRLSSAAHHLGTVRMSKNSQQGCVDSNLKVFGTDNVYICDGSVFATAGNSNPTLTCMALASRLGEYLIEK